MKLLQTGVFLGLATLSAVSSAAVDVSATVTEIGTAAAPIAAIGGGVLLVMVGLKIYKWVRRSL